MIEIQNTKAIIMIQPETKANGDFASNANIDVSGWNHLRVLFLTGVMEALSSIVSTSGTTAPLIEEADTSGGSYTAVAGAALSAAIGAADDNKVFAIDVDLTKSHKRYMRVQAPNSPHATAKASLCIIGILSRPNIGPKNAAEQGLEELITA